MLNQTEKMRNNINQALICISCCAIAFGAVLFSKQSELLGNKKSTLASRTTDRLQKLNIAHPSFETKRPSQASENRKRRFIASVPATIAESVNQEMRSHEQSSHKIQKIDSTMTASLAPSLSGAVESLTLLAKAKWDNSNGELSKIKSKGDAMNFLAQQRLEDPNAIRFATPLVQSNEFVEQFRGRFEGELVWAKLASSPVGVSVDFSPIETPTELLADAKIELSVAGVSIEKRQFRPSLATMTNGSGKPTATVVALNERRYLQLFFVEGLKSWIGNYYMTNPVTGELQFVASTILEHRNI